MVNYSLHRIAVEVVMDWVRFIGTGKEPAKLLCVKSGSGVIVGRTYTCWQVKKGKYRILNNLGNDVLIAKGYFSISSPGDVLTTP
jgi:hypothetical protein